MRELACAYNWLSGLGGDRNRQPRHAPRLSIRGRAARLVAAAYVILAFSLNAHATAYTASVTGDWTNTATWGGSGPPVSGDTVTINNGITVTITTAVTVGASPADDTGTAAIQCSATNGTGILNISAGGSLTYQGTVKQCAATWTIQPGGTAACQSFNAGGVTGITTCTLVHDSHLAAVPSTANYSWSIGAVNCAALPCPLLILNGSSGNRVNIGIAASSGNSGGFRGRDGAASTPFNGGGVIQATYANFNKCGNSSTVRCTDAYPFVSGQSMTMDHVHCEVCYPNRVYGQKNSVTYALTHFTRTNNPGGTGSVGMSFLGGTQPSAVATGTTYKCTDCYIDGPLEFKVGGSFGGQDAKVTLNRVLVVGNAGTSGADGPFQTGATSPGFYGTEWDEVILDNVGTSGTPASNPPANLAYRTALLASANVTNLHMIGNSIKISITWDGGWMERQFDDGTQDNSSDGIQTTNGASASAAVIVKNWIEVPTPNGNQCPMTLVNHSPGAQCDNVTANLWCPVISVIQNTYCGNTSSTGVAGVGIEGFNGIAGIFAHVNSNIVSKYGTAGAGWIVHAHTSVTPANGSFVDADYNVWWNLNPHTNTDMYLNGGGAQYSSPAPPGGNDTNANPGFVDTTRGFLDFGKKFCSSSATTWANVLTELAKMNDDTGNLAMCNIDTAFNYVKGGFRPTNGAIATSGEGAIRPGAVPLDFAFETAGDHSCGASANYCAFRPAVIANGGN